MFKVGDEVVCVDAVDTDPFPLIRGSKYVVTGFRLALGIEHICVGNRNDDGEDYGYYPWRFVKLPKQTVEHEETAEA